MSQQKSVKPPNSDEANHCELHTRLTGVMTSANRRYASINHNLYKEGDEVQPGWSVRSIDGTTRRVVVEHTSGATIELFAE